MQIPSNVGGQIATLGNSIFPAKYQFDVSATPDCTKDFVAFTSRVTGGTNLDVYALNNLYVNAAGTGACPGTVPKVIWAYHERITLGATANSSLVLSPDGKQMAWVEGGSGGAAILHILRPVTGDGETGGAFNATYPSPTTTTATAATYKTCLAGATSCELHLSFANGADETNSSPFYDYSDDVIFVGDASGNLHAFSGVFKGTPAELTTGWPVAVHAGTVLSSPVYDTNTEHVFVGDSGGRLSYVTVASGFTSGTLGGTVWNIGTSIQDAPIVDGTTGEVFVFALKTTAGGGGPGDLIGEANTSLGAQSTPVNVGAGTAHPFHAGTFDNQYYTSDTGPGTGTGFLYVCGNNGAANHALIQRIAVASGALGALDGTHTYAASSNSSECSPISEFYNSSGTPADYIFFSVLGTASDTGACGAGNSCVLSMSVASGTFNTTPLAGLKESGGTSGIVVDNNGTVTGASSIYFTPLAGSSATYPCGTLAGNTGGTGCAVKATQAQLL